MVSKNLTIKMRTVFPLL